MFDDVVFTACGTTLVVLVWVSVLRTTLVPGPSPSRMARWTARVCAAVAIALARGLPARSHDVLLRFCTPVGLFAMAAGWLVGLAVGFVLLVAVFGPGTVLMIAAGVSTALVTAAFTAYLVRFMDAHGRRERMIARLATQVQRVTDADALVAQYLRAGSRDSLDRYFAQWTAWLADIHVTHMSYPGLVYFHATGRLCWPTAAVAVMDAAALVDSVAPHWAPLHTRVLLDVGSTCLQGLAREAGIVLPHLTISLHGREERGFSDSMRLAVDSGLPAERDVERAGKAFQEIRVRYAPYAMLIGSRLLRR